MNQPANVTVVHVQAKSNGLGLAGLILSILGWFTCGLLCIPGALFSLVGLLFAPRGTALAGLIVGFPGTLFFVFFGLTMLTGFLGLSFGPAYEAREAARQKQEKQAMEAAAAIDDGLLTATLDGEVPSESAVTETELPSQEPGDDAVAMAESKTEPTPAVAPGALLESPPTEPEQAAMPSVIRILSSADGKFSVRARILEVADGEVKIERVDNGKILKVPIDRLSVMDKYWLNENFPTEDK
jgi:hypothetical protein